VTLIGEASPHSGIADRTSLSEQAARGLKAALPLKVAEREPVRRSERTVQGESAAASRSRKSTGGDVLRE
jgi:hypothetical protein